MDIHTFRLKPGQDLFEELERFTSEHIIEAGCVICAVGSLTHATLRLANREFTNDYDGHFEIVSMTGTVSTHGSHLHLSISDTNGVTIGGHLGFGCKIYTTAEIVLAAFPQLIYQRELCEISGYEELVVYQK
jgi:predicted DNA-binding protein with PD1-like motif